MKTTNAAIVWLRYRAKYGESPSTVLMALEGGSIPEQISGVATLYSEMLKGKKTPQQLVEEWRADLNGFFEARATVQTLHNGYEPLIALKESKTKSEMAGKEPPPNDEYTLTARMAIAGLPSCLLYELPYYAIEVILNRHAALQPHYDGDTGGKDGVRRRAASPEEIARFHGL